LHGGPGWFEDTRSHGVELLNMDGCRISQQLSAGNAAEPCGSLRNVGWGALAKTGGLVFAGY